MKQKSPLLQQLLSGALFIAVIILLGWLSNRYKAELDWTAGGRNTLTEASVKQLGSMTDPIRFYAFNYSGDENRKSLEADIRRYQRVKPNVELSFIDPRTQPQKVKEFNISFAGEVVVEYQGRRENLRASTEQAITGALQRLSFSGEQWVVFLEGHGERSMEDAGKPAEWGRFTQTLRDKGLKLQALNLTRTPKVPDNTSVLVIAAPQSNLLEGEVKLIQEYVERGGNLLWLNDPEAAQNTLDPLAKSLGITWLNGFVLDPVAQQLGLPAGFYVPGDYPQNDITKGFEQITLFALARAMISEPAGDWTVLPLLTTVPEATLEMPGADGQLVPVAGAKGPFVIGTTLTREVKGADNKPRAQRVIVLGDADFLSNQFVGQQGNQPFGNNLIQWLAYRDSQLNIEVPKAPDTALFVPEWAELLIAGVFILGLPLLLLGFGITRWVLRRRR